MKLSYKSQEFARLLMDKQLEFHNIDTNELLRLISIKFFDDQNIKWYDYYKFKCKEDWEAWKEFCINALINSKEGMRRSKAEVIFEGLDALEGLNKEYNE